MSIAFNTTYYLTNNEDVAKAVVNQVFTNAEQHFNLFGFAEGRDPNATFDTSYYLAQNPDVAEAGVNPLQHFIQFGAAEGRKPNANFVDRADFDTAAYAAANADLAEAGITTPEALYAHFATFGFAEDRPGVQTTDGTPITNTNANSAGGITLSENTDDRSGTSQPDVFNASLKILEGQTVNTLNNADQLDGGAGNDILNVQLNANASPAQLKSIETVNLETTAAAVLNAVNSDAITTVNFSNLGGNASVTNVPTAVQNVSVTNNAGNNAILTVNQTALTGTEDAVTLSLDGVTNAGATTISISGLSATASGYETINIKSAGNNPNAFQTLTSTGNSVANLNVEGTQDLTIVGALATTINNIDATKATGDVSLVSGSTTGNVTAKFGTGTDSFSLAAAAGTLTATDSLDGGDGVDTLIVDDGDVTGLTDATKLNGAIDNFETLTIATAIGAGAAIRIDRVDEKINDVNVSVDTAGAATFTFNEGASTIEYNGNATPTGGTQTFDAAGTKTDDSLVVDIDTGFASTITGDLVSTDFEVLTIDTEDGALTLNNVTMTASAGGSTTLNFTGDQNIIVGGGDILTADKIDASGLTNNASLTMTTAQAAAGGEQNITGSAGNDTLFGSDATTGDTISGGAGNDIIEGGVGGDSLSGGAGDDDFVFTTAADSVNSGAVRAFDIITDFTSGSDDLDVANVPLTAPGTAPAGGAAQLVNLGDIASTGVTNVTLDADIATALAGAGGAANALADAGDAVFFRLTGDSLGGNNMGFLVIETGGNGAYDAGTDIVIGLQGVTSLAIGDFI